jgi:hypothetical protein
MRPVLILVGFLLASGCGPRGVPNDAASLRRDVGGLVAEISTLRGLRDERRTRVLFDDDETFAAALTRKVEQDAIGPTPEDTVAFYLAFDPPSPSPTAERAASASEVIAEQIIAFYDRWTHAVHIRESSLDDQSENEVVGVVAHEIAHSLQQQHLPFPDLADIRERDSRLSHNAVLEGDAMLVMIAHLAQRNRIPVTRALAKAAVAVADREFERYAKASGANKALMGAPPLLREQLVFPYMAGLTFIGAIYRAGGFALVNKVFGQPPSTTEQVLHPEKYLAGEDAVAVTPPSAPDAYETVATGKVGELQIRVAFGQCMPQARAGAAAAGWGGDAYLIARSEDAGVLLWSTVWDDKKEAVEFEAALSTWAECTRRRAGSRVFPADDTIRRDGTKVALVRGLPGKQGDPAARALLALPAAPEVATPPFGPITIPPLRQARAFHAPYVSAGTYVNEELGLVSAVPAGFAVRMPDRTSAVFSRETPTVAVGGILLSEQLADAKTVDELHGTLAGHVQELIGDAQLSYVGGWDVQVPHIGPGIERSWIVKGTRAGLRAVVVPICQRTGSIVLWQLWVDDDGAAAMRYWLSTVRPTVLAEQPICAELNP